MKAVYCEMRAACCMLWVTMTIVNSARSCSISSSILAGRDRVERRGRLVEQDHLGAAGRWCGRCRGAAAGRRRGPCRTACSLSFTSSQRAALRSASSTRTSSSALRQAARRGAGRRRRCRRSTSGTGVGFWNTMPTRERSSFTSTSGSRMLRPSSRISPVGALLRIEAVDAVEGAQQGGLPAARRADQRRDLAVVEVEVDRLQAVEARRSRS